MKKNTIYLLILLSIALCFACERDSVDLDAGDETSEYEEKDIDNTWDSIHSTKIELLGSDVQITGEGAIFESNQLTISEGGEFIINGTLNSGNIKIAATEMDTVKLILDNVSLTSQDNACIVIEEADHVIMVLANESVNTLTDHSNYTSEEQNAVIFSKKDLYISGNGILKIEANYKDGITSKDGLVIYSGNYEIDAVDDGIRGKDFLVIKDGNYRINSGGDAILSDNDDENAGNISITKGIFDISTQADGITAQNNLHISNGTYTIKTNASGNSSSTKALKAGIALSIDNGNFSLESDDDAIHSDDQIIITDGIFTINSNDDAIHSNNTITIETAIITIARSVEGIESGYITVNDGTIIIDSSDDGFNATQGNEVMSNDGSHLIINGGDITVNMSGNDVDAMDSNGDITINGGILNLNIPTSGPAEALDANGSINIADNATVYENGTIYTESNNNPGRH